MLTKRCSDCKQDKPHDLFNKDRSRGDGLSYRCKACSSLRGELRYLAKRNEVLEQSRQRYADNKEARTAKIAQWQAANQDRVKANKQRYRQEHRERLAQANREWSSANRDRLNARDARRRAALIQATPAWANAEAIQNVYALAKQCEYIFGDKWSVDHIVPLRSSLVCGLHVEHNLRVIPLNQNKAKGNRYWPEKP